MTSNNSGKEPMVTTLTASRAASSSTICSVDWTKQPTRTSEQSMNVHQYNGFRVLLQQMMYPIRPKPAVHMSAFQFFTTCSTCVPLVLAVSPFVLPEDIKPVGDYFHMRINLTQCLWACTAQQQMTECEIGSKQTVTVLIIMDKETCQPVGQCAPWCVSNISECQ